MSSSLKWRVTYVHDEMHTIFFCLGLLFAGLLAGLFLERVDQAAE